MKVVLAFLLIINCATILCSDSRTLDLTTKLVAIKKQAVGKPCLLCGELVADVTYDPTGRFINVHAPKSDPRNMHSIISGMAQLDVGSGPDALAHEMKDEE